MSYAWGTAAQQPEIFYAAAVRSMSMSWHNFFFAAFDPQATMSIDKLPGALWLQALSVRLFGVHAWALNLPQVVEGVLTVLVLFRAVRRVSGAPAGVVAAVVYAATPATVALNRGNVSDSLLILLLVCAADAMTGALVSGRVAGLAWAGLWVGLAFQAKMLQAWLVLPGLLAALLVSSLPARRRLLGAGSVLLVCAVVSLSWMSVVEAVPEHDRPWVDGSHHDSVYEQVFAYNGVSRADTASASGLLSAESPLGRAVTLDSVSRVDRTVAGPGGRAAGWLLPLALLALLVLVMSPGAAGTEAARLHRAVAVFWGTWLVIDAVAFTVVDTLNAYYLAALSPPTAALIAMSVSRWASPRQISGRAWVVLLGLAAASVAYASWLSTPAPTAFRVLVPVVGLLLLVGAAVTGGSAARGSRLGRGLTMALAAVLVAPGAASAAVVHEHGGPFTTPFEPAAQRAVTQGEVSRAVDTARRDTPAIRAANYPLAAYTSLLAAPFVYATGLEVLPIGGFTGRSPAPTLARLQRLVRKGELHTVLLLSTDDRRAAWVRRTCRPLPGSVAAYFCG